MAWLFLTQSNPKITQLADSLARKCPTTIQSGNSQYVITKRFCRTLITKPFATQLAEENAVKILFFDPHSLIYSSAYLSRHDNVREAFKSQKPFSTSDHFLRHVEPDRAGAQKLARAATEAGLLLYPTGDHYTRDLLIKHNVFTDNQLAPYKHLMLRPDDNDPYRRMFAHAQTLEVDEWYVCGEMALDERLKSFPARNLVSTFGEGVSDDLISQIRALHLQH